MKISKYAVMFILMFFFILGGLSAGGGRSNSQSTDGEGRYSFSFMANFNQPEPPKPTTDMLQFWKNELKADVDFTWIPNSAYNDKLAAQMAALDLPNVIVVRGPKDPIIISAVRDGLFWQIDDYLHNPEYPNLARLNDFRVDGVRIDGKAFTLPRERDIIRSGIYFRQDWMDKLGLKTPKTIEDIYEMLKAFTERDPDGNGRNDTTGLVNKGPNIGSYVTAVSIYLGGGGEWYIAEDDTIKNEVDNPYYQKALDWFRDCYSKGYIMSNLPENNDDYGPFMQGRGGAVFTSAVTDIVDAQMRLSTVFPEGKVEYTINISSRSDGKIAMPASTGYTGGIMFPKIKTKTEAELSNIMKFFDSTGSDKNALIMRRGFEGKHYMIQDGKLVYTVEQLQKFREVDFPDADQIFPFNVTKPIPEMSADPLQQSITEDVDAYSGLLIANQSQLYLSETLVKNGTSLSNMLRDARMKYILGQLDLAGWKAVVEQWRLAGGAKAMEELTAAYKTQKTGR